jgi:uncharacterized protein (TIGR02246 family)
MSAAPPEETSREFVAAINAGDMRGGLELWSEDPSLIQPDGGLLRGRDAVETALAALVEHGVRMELELRSSFAAGDVALAAWALTITAAGPDGAPTRARSDALVVYRRDHDGRWRIALDAPWGLPGTPAR